MSNYLVILETSVYSYFEKRLSEKLRTQQSRKVIWDMLNTLFLTLKLSNPLLLLSFSPGKHMSMASRAILSTFFEDQKKLKPPTIPFRIVACTFSDNLSQNSCM